MRAKWQRSDHLASEVNGANPFLRKVRAESIGDRQMCLMTASTSIHDDRQGSVIISGFACASWLISYAVESTAQMTLGGTCNADSLGNDKDCKRLTL
ncbi:unnamed protein product [Lasius platythorax]|uniref:Uncharacterized protein n=1 Tax=Lasius platythorax TaxID=488582 RepID=A0AAV2P364_9HYME